MPLEASSSRQPTHSAVRAIYRAALEPARWPEALQAVAEVFEDTGAILIYGRDDGTFGVVSSPSLEHCVAEYASGWSDRDTRAIRGRERGFFLRRDVITDRDVITREEMLTDPFYVAFLPKHGLRYFACAMVSPDPRTWVGLSIQRAPDRPEYSEAELELAGELGAHVENSLRLSIRLMNAELVNAGLGEALARLGIGVFVLDSMSRVIFSNPAGELLLGDGLELVEGQLRSGASVSSRMDSEIAKAIADDPGTKPVPLLIERKRSRHPLAVYVVPVPFSENPTEHFLVQARALVLVIDPSTDAPPDPSLVRDLLGLTVGEARVAALIGSGLPPQEAAERLGVSVETARTVLKRVFQKVGVSRQSELTALMTRLLLR